LLKDTNHVALAAFHFHVNRGKATASGGLWDEDEGFSLPEKTGYFVAGVVPTLNKLIWVPMRVCTGLPANPLE